MWFFCGVLLGGLPLLALAQDVAPLGMVYYRSGKAVNFATVEEACASTGARWAGYNANWRGSDSRLYDPLTQAEYDGGSPVGLQIGACSGTTSARYVFMKTFCPAGVKEVRVEGFYYCRFDQPCPDGEERDPTTGQCRAPPCKAGQTGSTSIQVGWSNYWDVNAKPYGVTSPGAGCSGECKVNVTGLAEQSCYLGDSGAGAPYQVLCWYKTETTGEQCTSGEGQLSDRRDPIPCPAGTTQGTIGDKTACLPSTTTKTETTTNPDGTTTETTTKTNPDGSTEVTTTEKDASGNVTSSTTTNYPAPGSTGSGSSGGEPGEGGKDPLKECVENPDACKEGGGDFGAGAPDGAELFGRDEAKTFAAVLTKFRQDMGQTAFGRAAAGYFDVSGGGSCPVWSSTIPFIDTTITIDQFCDPAVADMLAVMKGALLVVFGFVAFRFAVL